MATRAAGHGHGLQGAIVQPTIGLGAGGSSAGRPHGGNALQQVLDDALQTRMHAQMVDVTLQTHAANTCADDRSNLHVHLPFS